VALGNRTTASGDYATALGGGSIASGYASTALGAVTTASGDYSTALGYYSTASGKYGLASGMTALAGGLASVALGYYAQAAHNGAFVWADFSSSVITASTNANSVTMRVTGGYRFFSNKGCTAGVFLGSNSTSWATISDRNAKKNFAAVDGEAVLDKLAAIPVQRWNYNWEADEATPNLGPMAQDFKAAFGLGDADTGIATVDEGGVALAAIPGAE